MSGSVEIVRKRNLCTACGTCASVCPYGAVSIVRNAADFLVPRVDPEKCTHCGLCLRACPGIGLPKTLTGQFEDIFVGENLGAWVGRAADGDLWKNGQSGGIASALLVYLMDRGEIDGAIVNGFDAVAKRPRVFVAHNKQEILGAQGSWYAQSAVNELAVGPRAERTAAVVLGCQGEGIALARMHAEGLPTPEYLIGLVCAGNHSGLIIDDLIDQSKQERGSVTSFRFRDKTAGGWPGNVAVGGEKGRAVLDKGRRIALKDCYANYRCQCCFDQMNLFSDVVVGDPWGLTDGRDRGGKSVVVARTEKGRNLIEAAIRDGAILAEPVAVGAVYKGQTVDSRLKPQFFACQSIARAEGLHFPAYELGGGAGKAAAADSKKLKQYRRTLRFNAALTGMESRAEVDKAVRQQKARIRLRSVPQRIAAVEKRVLRRLWRALKGKGEAQ